MQGTIDLHLFRRWFIINKVSDQGLYLIEGYSGVVSCLHYVLHSVANTLIVCITYGQETITPMAWTSLIGRKLSKILTQARCFQMALYYKDALESYAIPHALYLSCR